jgi:hypothetical protein
MTTFDKREEGFEKKFAHDEELRFKANARRNKLLGLWAAEKLGIVRRRGECLREGRRAWPTSKRPATNDVLQKVHKDLDAKGIASSDQDIRRAMVDLMEKAIAEIKASG